MKSSLSSTPPSPAVWGVVVPEDSSVVGAAYSGWPQKPEPQSWEWMCMGVPGTCKVPTALQQHKLARKKFHVQARCCSFNIPGLAAKLQR